MGNQSDAICPSDNKQSKVRREKCPRLKRDQIEKMINGEQAYSYTFKNGWVVPYVIPFNHKNGIVCVCSKFFSTEYPYREHIVHYPRGCIKVGTKPTLTKAVDQLFFDPTVPQIRYKSTEYDDLLKNPQWIKNGNGRFCLRMHPETTTVACICGKYMSIERIRKEHWENCPFIKKLIPPRHTISRLTDNTGSPFVEMYSSVEQIEFKFPYRDFGESIPRSACYTCYKPYHNNDATFWVPSREAKAELPKTIKSHMHHLDSVISLNWEEITQALDNYSSEGAREVQYNRYRIRLDFERNESDHWLSLCDTFGFNNKGVKDILAFAKKQTILDLGQKTYLKGFIHSPCIKMCMAENQEPFQASLSQKSHRRKYSMMLNDSGSTVIVAKPEHDNRIIDYSYLVDVLDEGTRLVNDNGSSWMRPSETLKKKILSLSTSLDSDHIATSLNGNLFSICHRDTPTRDSQTKEHHKDLFDWRSYRLRSVPSGTILSFDSSVLSADSGGEHKDVQSVLTWEWELRGVEKPSYDHKHWTKLITMMTIAETIWMILTSEEKKHMILLVFYCYITEQGCNTVRSSSKLLQELAKFPPLTSPNAEQYILAAIGNLVYHNDIF